MTSRVVPERITSSSDTSGMQFKISTKTAALATHWGHSPERLPARNHHHRHQHWSMRKVARRGPCTPSKPRPGSAHASTVQRARAPSRPCF